MMNTPLSYKSDKRRHYSNHRPLWSGVVFLGTVVLGVAVLVGVGISLIIGVL